MIRKKIATLTLSAVMILSAIAPSSALEQLEKIKGKNNYETAAKIAEKRSYSSVVLVNMDKTAADGLSSAALAGATNGVILLTSKNSTPDETKQKLKYVNNIYIIGSEAAISKSIEEDLVNSGKKVTRLGGADRYETSYKVAKEVLSKVGKVESVFVANGIKGEADIVSASPVSYREKAPILLTNGKTIKSELKDISMKASNRYIIGGDRVVTKSVEKSLSPAVRIGGKDRFSTNKKIVDKFYSDPKEFNIVDTSDYTMATIACSISTETPIALVDYRFDPIVLKNAEKITAIGNISDSTISKAIGYSGGFNTYNYDWTKNKYIAHALGGIDGKTYTNSSQALEQNRKKGFKVFEVDLDFSSDDELIAWHSFDKSVLKEMGVSEKYASKKPTLEEFKKIKSYGKYNTMSFKDIVSYMEEHKDIYIIIDLKQATDKKVKKLYEKVVEDASPEVLNRIIPQVYRESTYNEIMDTHNFKSLIYTCYAMDKMDENAVTNFCAMKGIKVLVVEGKFYTNSLMEKCNSRGIKLYMNTYNDKAEVDKYKKKGVHGFFTDFLTP